MANTLKRELQRRRLPQWKFGFLPIHGLPALCKTRAMKNCKFALTLAGVCACLAASTLHAQTILPFGDSVTSSQAGHNSYRRPLYHMLTDAGFGVNFVGSMHGVDGNNSTPPDPDFDMDHEGHPGWTSGVAAGAAGSVASPNIDIVLLDFGSNDPASGIPPEDTAANLEFIMETLANANPNIAILLAVPTGAIDVAKQDMSGVRKAVATAAKVEKKNGINVTVVSLSGVSPKKNTYDGIHPNEEGENKIAKKYFSAIKKVLR
jgi:acyl-CoA thioesterase-1